MILKKKSLERVEMIPEKDASWIPYALTAGGGVILFLVGLIAKGFQAYLEDVKEACGKQKKDLEKKTDEVKETMIRHVENDMRMHKDITEKLDTIIIEQAKAVTRKELNEGLEKVHKRIDNINERRTIGR